jgi:hypothetical protein
MEKQSVTNNDIVRFLAANPGFRIVPEDPKQRQINLAKVLEDDAVRVTEWLKKRRADERLEVTLPSSTQNTTDYTDNVNLGIVCLYQQAAIDSLRDEIAVMKQNFAEFVGNCPEVDTSKTT